MNVPCSLLGMMCREGRDGEKEGRGLGERGANHLWKVASCIHWLQNMLNNWAAFKIVLGVQVCECVLWRDWVLELLAMGACIFCIVNIREF